MKNLLLIAALFLAACTNNNTGDHSPAGQSNNWNVPKPGSIIATDSISVAEDELNDQYFAVAVIATDSSINGTYDVEAHYGYNTAVNTFRLPYGGEHYKPILRRGPEPYSYIIGFRFDDDTVFHEYYGVNAQRGQMMMKYLKAYTLQ